MKTETPSIPETVNLTVLSKRMEKEDGRKSFHFRLRLSNEGRSMEFDYSGGILAFADVETAKKHANRLWRPDAKSLLDAFRGKNPNGAAINLLFEISTPKIEQVLHSLILDGNSACYTFEDFCFAFGYDEDSRKALDIYLACQKTGADVRRVLGSSYSAVASALEDY